MKENYLHWKNFHTTMKLICLHDIRVLEGLTHKNFKFNGYFHLIFNASHNKAHETKDDGLAEQLNILIPRIIVYSIDMVLPS